jgi:hypothetical protein
MNPGQVALFSGRGGGGGGTITPIKRAPFGPAPQPIDYRNVLPFTPPGRDLHFYRGNFCGLTIPGAPPVPGGNDSNPEMVMACLLDNYPPVVQDQYLLAYAQAGYTHLQRSLGHSLYYGHSIEDHIILSRKAQGYGLFCDEWWLGGGEGDDWTFKSRDKDAAYWAPILQPYVDQLVGAGVVDCACVGWQLDQWNAPGNPIISIIAYLASALPQSVPLYTHWVNEALAWWKTGGEVWSDKYQTVNVDNRFSWWGAMQPYLTGGHHQGDNQIALTNPKLYQDKLLDTLDPFGGDQSKGNMGQSQRGGVLRPFSLVGFEVMAQFEFDARASELQGDQAGYYVMCTTSHTGLAMGGYGNGARRPDGTAL